MAYNNEYPYFSIDGMNADWLINQMKELRETVLGLENVKFLGENPATDWNKLDMQSIAVYTAGNASINAPMPSPEGLVYTNGDETYSAYQIFFADNGDRWFRHYVTSWSTWIKTDFKNYRFVEDIITKTDTNFNNLPIGSIQYMNATDWKNNPVNNYGYCITFGDPNMPKSDHAQVFYIFETGVSYWRYFTGGTWKNWSEIKPLNNYIHNAGRASTAQEIDNAKNNTVYFVYNAPSNFPVPGGYGALWTFADLQAPDSKQQMFFDRWSGNYWFREYQNGTWLNWINKTNDSKNYRFIDNIITSTGANFNNLPICSVQYMNASDWTNNPTNNYGYTFTFGDPSSPNGDHAQMFFIFETGVRYWRYFTSGRWTNWTKVVQSNTYATAVASNISDTNVTAPLALFEEDSEDDTITESQENFMTPPTTMFDDLNPTKWLRCPGQGLFAHDEDAQSFAHAILSEDLSDIEYIVTNFEMYDMQLSLEDITTRVTVLADAIKNSYPLTELVIMGIPPIDVPFWGSEFFDYPMPNEITIRELDAKMEELALQYGFRYVTWQNFDPIKIENLLDDHPDILQSSLYEKKLKGFVKSSVN